MAIIEHYSRVALNELLGHVGSQDYSRRVHDVELLEDSQGKQYISFYMRDMYLNNSTQYIVRLSKVLEYQSVINRLLDDVGYGGRE